MRKILVSGTDTQSVKPYIKAVKAAGGTAFQIDTETSYASLIFDNDNFRTSMVESYDGLILAGGGDVNPILYGEKNCASRRINDMRDLVEITLANDFVAAGLPVFGICRGMQVLNVAFGGSLNQDDGSSFREYHGAIGSMFSTHAVTCKASFMQDLYGEKYAVNSRHHQSIKTVADCFEVIQLAEGCECIEAIEHKTAPCFGVQWHPERLCDDSSLESQVCVDGTKLFKYFIQLVDQVKEDIQTEVV